MSAAGTGSPAFCSSLIDETLPPSTERVLEVACELAPWVRDKMTLVEARIAEGGVELPRETGVVAVHACGALTDDAIDLAIDLGGPVAVMPCCCHPKSPDAPQVLYQELGVRDGVDTHRTYRLHQAGYNVKWRYVAEDITPMNRVIIGGKFSRRL